MSPSARKQYLLLDTCIAEYWLDRYLQPSISVQLSKWADHTFDLAISEISFSELIDGAYKDKIVRVKQLLTSYAQIPVSQRILCGAGVLSNIYKTQNMENCAMGLADKIIAATSFVHNLPLITSNIKDFPHPFFTTIASETLSYRKKNIDHYFVIDLMKPNNTMVKYWYSRTQ